MNHDVTMNVNNKATELEEQTDVYSGSLVDPLCPAKLCSFSACISSHSDT